MPEISFRDDPVEQTVELLVDGAVASLVAYDRGEGPLALTHTETRPEFAGQGYGTQLIDHVVERAKADGDAVIPYCSFVAAWFARHPDEVGLVPADHRALLDAH